MSLIRAKALYLALFMILIVRFNSLALLIVLPTILVYLLKYHHNDYQLMFGFLLAFTLIINVNYERKGPPNNTCIVSDIRTKYVVADCGKKAIIYKADNLYIGDKIEIQGEFQSINQNGNFFGYSFSKTMARNNIYYQITPSKIKVISRSNSLGHQIYGRINRMENVEQRNIIKSYLYGFSNEDENLNSYVKSSGMHVSTLISWLYSLLVFIPVNYVSLVLCLFVLFIGNITRFSFSLKRIFIFLAIKFILPKEDAKTRLGLSIILILLISPNAIYELG
ncbi:MAG: hypothetical protein RR929_00870, partial [Erysipelotrichaceae bacterium]